MLQFRITQKNKVSSSALFEQFLICYSSLISYATILRLNKDCGWGRILILVARTLGDSQELFIAISTGYSFPGMHCVTSKEGIWADGEIVINRSINTVFVQHVFPLLTNDRCLPLSDQTSPDHEFGSAGCDVVIRVQQQNHSGKVSHRNSLLTTVGLPYASSKQS